MKIHKVFITLLLVIALAVPSAFAQYEPGGGHEPLTQDYGGDSGTGSGGCLDAYNNCLNRCDYLGGTTQIACKWDCLVSYYSCLYYTATQ